MSSEVKISLPAYLEKASMTQLQEIIKSMRCEVSFWKGRKFVHNKYEGTVTYNQVIDLVYNKVMNNKYSAHIKEISADLEKLHKLGEDELATKDIFTRIFTAIKSFFTSFGRSATLDSIRKKANIMYGDMTFLYRTKEAKERAIKDREVYYHLVDRKDEIVKHLNDLFSLNLTVENLSINIGYLQFKESSNRQNYHFTIKDTDFSFDRTSPVVFAPPYDTSSATKEEVYEAILEKIKVQYPLWVKVNETLIEMERNHSFEKYLLSHPTFIHLKNICNDVNFAPHIWFSYQFSKDGQSISITPHFKLNRSLQGLNIFSGEIINEIREYEFREGVKININIKDKLSSDQLMGQFKAKLDDYMDDFLLESLGLKQRPGFGEGFNFFPGIFGGIPFGENMPFADDEESDPMKDLAKIEEMMKKGDTLTQLVKNQQWADVRKEFKKVSREGQLKLHPDKAGDQNKELFQTFQGAVKGFEKWLEKQPNENMN